jgi:hypothetical protein
MPRFVGIAHPHEITFIMYPLAIERNHELGAALASVIASGAYLELALGTSLARFLGTNVGVGIAVYNEIVTAKLQRQVVQAAAKLFFKEEQSELDLFCQLLESAGMVGKDRNNVAHGLWAHTFNFPDILLRINQRDWLEWHGAFPTGRSTNTKAIEEWSVDDFRDLIADIKHVTLAFNLFWAVREMPAPQSDQSRSSLSTLRQLRTRKFHPPSLASQNVPSTPKQWPHAMQSPAS